MERLKRSEVTMTRALAESHDERDKLAAEVQKLSTELDLYKSWIELDPQAHAVVVIADCDAMEGGWTAIVRYRDHAVRLCELANANPADDTPSNLSVMEGTVSARELQLWNSTDPVQTLPKPVAPAEWVRATVGDKWPAGLLTRARIIPDAPFGPETETAIIHGYEQDILDNLLGANDGGPVAVEICSQGTAIAAVLAETLTAKLRSWVDECHSDKSMGEILAMLERGLELAAAVQMRTAHAGLGAEPQFDDEQDEHGRLLESVRALMGMHTADASEADILRDLKECMDERESLLEHAAVLNGQSDRS